MRFSLWFRNLITVTKIKTIEDHHGPGRKSTTLSQIHTIWICYEKFLMNTQIITGKKKKKNIKKSLKMIIFHKKNEKKLYSSNYYKPCMS